MTTSGYDDLDIGGGGVPERYRPMGVRAAEGDCPAPKTAAEYTYENRIEKLEWQRDICGIIALNACAYIFTQLVISLARHFL